MQFTDFKSVVDFAISVLKSVVPIIFSLALVFFFWGVVRYIYNAGDSKQAGEAKQIMLWGIIGLFVMASIFGILTLLQNSFLQ
jgi:hypothetical protein